MNSLDAASALRPATASFKKYSTALTSWLVVVSMVLIRPASCNENEIHAQVINLAVITPVQRRQRGERARFIRRGGGKRIVSHVVALI